MRDSAVASVPELGSSYLALLVCRKLTLCLLLFQASLWQRPVLTESGAGIEESLWWKEILKIIKSSTARSPLSHVPQHYISRAFQSLQG